MWKICKWKFEEIVLCRRVKRHENVLKIFLNFFKKFFIGNPREFRKSLSKDSWQIFLNNSAIFKSWFFL